MSSRLTILSITRLDINVAACLTAAAGAATHASATDGKPLPIQLPSHGHIVAFGKEGVELHAAIYNGHIVATRWSNRMAAQALDIHIRQCFLVN